MKAYGSRLVVIAVLAAAAAGFAALNGGVRVTLRLGLVTLRHVPLPVVVFVAIVLGMTIVFLAGLRADVRTRHMLRRYREALGGEEWAGGPRNGGQEED